MRWTARTSTTSAYAGGQRELTKGQQEFSACSGQGELTVCGGQRELPQSQQMRWTVKTRLMRWTLKTRYMWWTVRTSTKSANAVDCKNSIYAKTRYMR